MGLTYRELGSNATAGVTEVLLEGIVKDGWAGRPIQLPIGSYRGRPIPVTGNSVIQLQMLDSQGPESIVQGCRRAG